MVQIYRERKEEPNKDILLRIKEIDKTKGRQFKLKLAKPDHASITTGTSTIMAVTVIIAAIDATYSKTENRHTQKKKKKKKKKKLVSMSLKPLLKWCFEGQCQVPAFDCKGTCMWVGLLSMWMRLAVFSCLWKNKMISLTQNF